MPLFSISVLFFVSIYNCFSCGLLQVERCLRLLKRFSPKDFNYSGKKQFLKFGRSIQKTEQTLELAVDNQIYDMVDAEGSKGLAVMEVFI